MGCSVYCSHWWRSDSFYGRSTLVSHFTTSHPPTFTPHTNHKFDPNILYILIGVNICDPNPNPTPNCSNYVVVSLLPAPQAAALYKPLGFISPGLDITLSRTSLHYVSLALCNAFLTYGIIQVSHISLV